MQNIHKSFLFIVVLLCTNLMANGGEKEKKYTNQKEYKYTGYKNSNKKEKTTHRGDIARFFIGSVYELELTHIQENEIDTALIEFKKKRFDKFEGFTKDGFDKKAYIKARMKSKEDKIKQSADLLEKIYTILDKEQIIIINNKLTQFKKMQKKRGKDGSSCDDRR